MQAIGLEGLAIWSGGFKQLTSNYPLISPKDFNKLTFATKSNPLVQDQFRLLGAVPVDIDPSRIKKFAH